MTKEELNALKEKISKLSKQENDERDVYLRNLATGKIQGPPTEYPSINKPWLQYYDEKDILEAIPKRRMYEDLIEYNKHNMSEIAIEYYGNTITYRELFANIEKVASALAHDGIKKGDVVSLCLPYLPETIYTIYALNKIGAIVNMIDPRINEQLITEYINNANSKYMIIIDKIEEKVSKLLPSTEVRKVVSISPLISHGNNVIKTIAKLKQSEFTKWKEFIDVPFQKTEIAEYHEKELAVIEYTSGTSGIPKGVMLANESFNSLAHFQFQSLKNNVGDKFLLIMPPFIAYGLVIGMHDMLCQGQHLIMIPNFTLDKAPKMLPQLIDKYHPEYIMGVPNFLSILMDYKKDLSFLKGMIVGGDHLDPEVEKRGRAFLARRGSKAGLYKGWGMTEIASCGTFTKNDVENRIGSVGIPLSKSNVMILRRKDNDERYDINEPELGYNQEGILFVSSPAATLGYFKKEEATNEIIYIDNQGTKWINTGDIFMMDDSGNLYFKGREKRIVVRPDGHNIPTSQIESIGNSHNSVKNAIVVGTPSTKYEHGNNATLCLSLRENNVTYYDAVRILEEIKEECNKKLQPRDRAKYYILTNEIAYTMNGKVDYKKMTQYAISKIAELQKDEESQDVFYIIDENTVKQSKKRTLKKK